MKKLPVYDVVAEDWWEYHYDDRVYVVHVAIGRPVELDGTWSCPLRIDGAHEVWNPFSKHKRWKGWRPIEGQGPFDAIMNGLMFAFRMFSEFHPQSVAGRVKALGKSVKKPARKKRSRARR